MPVEVAFPGNTVEITSGSSIVEIVQESSGSIVIEGAMGSAAIYGGPYVVIPKVSQQTLETNEKLMRDDVTVRGVPRYDVRNEYGTTCSIAVEV